MSEHKKDKAMDDGKSERASSTDEAREPTRGISSREGARRATEPLDGKTPELLAPISVATKLERIAARSRERPQEVITNVNHLIDVEWLREAHRRTRKDGASGVDDMTADEYATRLDENLASLCHRFRSRTYRAPPVRRVHIPKGDGSKTRPIGVPTFEDKILQRAVAMFLEAVYEQQFRNCSYGFRPRRSQHDALDALRAGLMRMEGGFVIEIDIQSFFDSLDHSHLRRFLDLRVRDGVIRQAIGSWLKAGVLEDGRFERSDEGTPQGGVVSPLLANVFLHHVLDEWFEDEISPRLAGRSFLVRYADDAVIVVDNEEDAARVMNVLPKRFGRYGLTLHPEKTRRVRFMRPVFESKGKGRDDDDETPGTFNFLGFTHYWGSTRKGGRAVKRRTEAKRLRRKLKEFSVWCEEKRHLPVSEQHAYLSKALVGYDGYYGVTGNSRALRALRHWLERIWRFWLNRRSQRRDMPWERFKLLLARYPLPPPTAARRYRHAAASP
jgi:RNA-directed DNA polymerase